MRANCSLSICVSIKPKIPEGNAETDDLVPSLHPNFYKLLNVAEPLMEQPRTLAGEQWLQGWKTVFRIRNYPSFEANVVWDVATSVDASAGSVVELIWDRPSDGRRFMDPLYGVAHQLKLRPMPSLAFRATAFSAQVVSQLLEALDFRMFIPGLERGIFLDGDHSYIETFDEQGEVRRFHWENSTLPDAYRELASWKQRAIEILLRELTNAEAIQIEVPGESGAHER
jgi:hypothetical protein